MALNIIQNFDIIATKQTCCTVHGISFLSVIYLFNEQIGVKATSSVQ